MLIKEAWAIVGGLSNCTKMPGYSYGLPTIDCNVGSKLREVSGSVCERCYAHDRGHYQYDSGKIARERRAKSLEDPRWMEAMTTLINNYKKPFRWHDSGDVQSLLHLVMIVGVAKRTPDVQHWLPTKEKRIVKSFLDVFKTFPPNLNVQMSGYMVDGPPVNMGEHSDAVSHHITYTKTSAEGFMIHKSYVCPVEVEGAISSSCAEAECYACWDKSVPVVAGRLH
jgi:hypothetical protein